MSDHASACDEGVPTKGRLPAVLLLAVLIVCLVFAFRSSLVDLLRNGWASEEYNHGYLIPFVALFLIATRARQLAAVPWPGSAAGLGLVVAGFVLLLMSTLSSIYTLGQIGFVIAIWGCFLTVFGWRPVMIIWPALIYLMFMVPLPDFLQFRLSSNLQLWSSQLGVAVIRLAGMTVYLEGNIIDLGIYQLQVAEACSGMRYLFPLMSFGFLCAVIFQGSFWQRAVIFLSAAPITIFANSFRVGMIGILVNLYGIEQAEGFLHFFEGWIVFMFSVGILFLEMYLMARMSGRRLVKSLDLDTPPTSELLKLAVMPAGSRLATVVLAGVVVGAGLTAFIGDRQEVIPDRGRLAGFPLAIGEWRGVEQPVEKAFLTTLAATDTLMSTFSRPEDPSPVGLWIAYYASQRSGKAVHSPAACLPGGGWLMESLKTLQIPDVLPDGRPLPVNRARISQGREKMLVYYWFPQRGRDLTNEYLVKWYMFLDSLTQRRSDGALVRLITPIDDTPQGEEQAEQRLQDMLRAIHPKLAYYLPDQHAAVQALARID